MEKKSKKTSEKKNKVNSDAKSSSNNELKERKGEELVKYLENLINELMTLERKNIFEHIKKTNNFNDKEAHHIEEIIHESTMNNMFTKYVIDDMTFSYLSILDSEFPFELLDSKNKMLKLSVYYYFNTLFILLFQSLGDTIGYNNGHWEFNYGEKETGPEYTNELISEFISMGGINDIDVTNWKASDDTVMYYFTYRIISVVPFSEYGKILKEVYVEGIDEIRNRNPGETTMRSLAMQETIEWDKLPYNSMDIGAGAVMSAGCIGIIYPPVPLLYPEYTFIKFAVETSRITHNSALSILGCVVTSLFTSFGLSKMPIERWPGEMMPFIKSDVIDNYIKDTRPSDLKSFVRDKILFVSKWEQYIATRFYGNTFRSDLRGMKNPVSRIKILSENFSKANINFPGSCADDSLIFAFDALISAGTSIEKLLIYSILHYGDSDTVGSIAFSWFAAYHINNIKLAYMIEKMINLEFYDTIVEQHYKIYSQRKLLIRSFCKYYSFTAFEVITKMADTISEYKYGQLEEERNKKK